MFKDKALELAEQHYAVFPLKPNSKTPLTPNGFKDATTDPVKIEAWAKKFPDANIGIACGSASHHLVVVDIDNKHGVNGTESIRKWQEEHGDFPATKTIMTPTGGYHLYFRDMTEYGSPVGILDGVDIRANGSYVVAEGSTIFGDEYKAIDTSIPAMTNRSVIDLLNHCRVDRSESSGGNRFEYATEKVATGRNNYLISYAGYYCKVNPNASLDDAKSSIIEENNERCDPPLSIAEIEKTVFKSLPKILEREKKKHEDEGYVLPGCFDEEFLKEISTQQQPQQADGDGLPPFIVFSDLYNQMPPLKPVLIDGILRQGHKMIISAGSKAGKSFLLINLGIMISQGWNWLGHKCKKGKVLYINMEIDFPSFVKRVDDLHKKLGLDTIENRDNFVIWNLRGQSLPLSKLSDTLLKRIKGDQYSAIIVDPLYKVMEGDENSNSDIAKMVIGFDKIADETGASVIYAHHYSKGYAGDKQVIDRSSGAGVFARDPDAIISMSEIDIPEPDGRKRGFRIEYVLREFKTPDPTNVWFEAPLHTLDTSGYLEKFDLMTSESAKKKRRDDAKREREAEDVKNAYECVPKDELDRFTLTDFMTEMDIKNRGTAKDILLRNGFKYEHKGSGNSALWFKNES